MRDLRLKIGGQVDNVDCRKGALLHTNTTSNAESFGNEGNFRFWRNFDAKLARTNNRTRLLAFLTAFLVWMSVVVQ